MTFTLQTDYALRALMYLAVQQRRVTIDELARFYGISAAHVAKVVNRLARWGYVRCVRGAGGGLELQRDPADISIGEVIRMAEGSRHLLDCIGTEGVCAIETFCRLKGVLAEAERRQTEYLQGVTLHDVLPTSRQIKHREVAQRAGTER